MASNLDFRHQFSFVCGLFQKDLWQEVQVNYDYISDYFLKGDMDKKNSVTVSILNYLHQTPAGEYDADKFYAYLLTSSGLIKEEALEICNLVDENLRATDRSRYSTVSKQLKDIAYSIATERALAVSKNDPTVYVDELKKFEYHSSFSEKIVVQYLNQFTVDQVRDEFLDPSKVLQSAFPFINRSSALGGWPVGQIIAVTSPPGGGKTLYMMKECSHMAKQGHKSMYIALADMNISDFYIRLYSMDNFVPFENSTTTHFEKAHAYGASFGNMIAIIIEASNVISMDEVVDLILQNYPDIEVVFADYDSQFAMPGAKGSMYDDAVLPYISASRLKKAGITTFIGCQPKQLYYGQDYLDLSALGESSKKQHCIDFMIAIGTNDETKVPCGYFSMPKARRVFSKFKVPYIRSNCGSMIEVPYSLYNKYRGLINDPTLTHERIMTEISQLNSPGAVYGDGQIPTGSVPGNPTSTDNPLMNIGSIGPAPGEIPMMPTI